MPFSGGGPPEAVRAPLPVHAAPAAGGDEAHPRRPQQGLQQTGRHDAHQGDEGWLGKHLNLMMFRIWNNKIRKK